MENILLVEPNYNNKYPPIGLMKIATYHKNKGDIVEFYKGKAPFTQISRADKVYITSLFTFYFDITVDTIKHYLNYKSDTCVFLGGISATLMPERFYEESGIKNIISRQLTDSIALGYNDHVDIDALPLDYDILDDISHKYPASDNFIVYASRGCPRECSFCAVKTLEPEFVDTNNLICQIQYIREKYGDKRHILLMDNNILYSRKLQKVSLDLETLGFVKNTPNYIPPNNFNLLFNKIRRRTRLGNSANIVSDELITFLEEFKSKIKKESVVSDYIKCIEDVKANDVSLEILEYYEEYLSNILDKYRIKKPLQRYVDFNQGIDARLLSKEKMKFIENLPLRPFRLAYDNINDTEIYRKAFRTSYSYGVRHFSNYMLYNYKDTPQELWERGYNNIRLFNEVSDVSAFSFPMKYAPIDMVDRSYIGEHWNKKYLSAMNIILNVTNGVMAKEEDFFFKAYGSTSNDFLYILTMPNEFIKYRLFFEKHFFIDEWGKEYKKLSNMFKNELIDILSEKKKKDEATKNLSTILKYYTITKHQVEVGKITLNDIKNL